MKQTIAAAVMMIALTGAASAGWGDFTSWAKGGLDGLGNGDCYKYVFTAGKEGGDNCDFSN